MPRKPDGGKRVEDTYLDGRSYKITGDEITGEGAVLTAFAYTPVGNAGMRTKVTSGASGEDTWRESYMDMAGRTKEIWWQYPGSNSTATIKEKHEYDNDGRPKKIQVENGATPVAVERLFDYTDTGLGVRRSRAGLDYSGDGALAASGSSSTDEITETERRYTYSSGYWWAVVETYGYINQNASRSLLQKVESRMRSKANDHGTYDDLVSVTKTTDASGATETVSNYVKRALNKSYVLTVRSGATNTGVDTYLNERLESHKAATHTGTYYYY